MHDTVNPFIETMDTAINRQEAAMLPRPEGTGHPGHNPATVKEVYIYAKPIPLIHRATLWSSIATSGILPGLSNTTVLFIYYRPHNDRSNVNERHAKISAGS
ncbi:MAG: hypothetical protein ACJ8AG_29540, partial [Ktedonobacteraceae bacterium]